MNRQLFAQILLFEQVDDELVDKRLHGGRRVVSSVNERDNTAYKLRILDN